MENPFLGLYQIMGEATNIEPSFFIAKVKAPLPDLEVQLNDIILDKEDLLIDKWLLDRNKELFTEDVEEHTHISEYTMSSENKHRHDIKKPIQDKLEIDDKVVLLRINDKFIVLSKVVNI